MEVAREPETNVEIIFADWLDAIRRGDIDRIARRLAPEVVHRGVRPDLICPDRDAVLANVSRTAANLPQVDAIELIAAGDRVLLSVRAEGIGQPGREDEPPRGSASIVFTLRDGRIVDIQDYLGRDEALAAIGAEHLARWA
jgi:ketosteroid isomerase-like protein